MAFSPTEGHFLKWTDKEAAQCYVSEQSAWEFLIPEFPSWLCDLGLPLSLSLLTCKMGFITQPHNWCED